MKKSFILMTMLLFLISCNNKYNQEDVDMAFAEYDLGTLVDMRAYPDVSSRADSRLNEYFHILQEAKVTTLHIQNYEKHKDRINNILSNRLQSRKKKLVVDTLKLLAPLRKYEILINEASYGTVGYESILRVHQNQLMNIYTNNSDQEIQKYCQVVLNGMRVKLSDINPDQGYAEP